MKNKKTLLSLLAASIFITSCAGIDGYLVSKTGLKSTDIILIGLRANDRARATISEIEAAKTQNTYSK